MIISQPSFDYKEDFIMKFNDYKAQLANASDSMKEKLLTAAEQELSSPEFWALRRYAFPDLEVC